VTIRSRASSLPLKASALRFVDKIAVRFARVASEQYSARSQYLAMSTLAGRYGLGGLETAELRVFSQNGEDGVLAELFSRIGTTNRCFVEFGASDGVECNTRFLMETLGWSGVYLESDQRCFARLSERLASRDDVETIRALVGPDNVCSLFEAAQVPSEPDLVSIDIDGQDYWVWEALEGYRPRIVIVEYNATLSGCRVERRRAPADAGTIKVGYRGLSGASRDALEALGKRKGYVLVYAELAGVNLFFVREDLAGPFTEHPRRRGANFGLVGRKHAIDPGDYVEV
jgi:hypothetical protein